MGLNTRKNEPFTTVTKNSSIQGDNIIFIKGGSTVIDNQWIKFDDLRINVAQLIDSWIAKRSSRVFNDKNGFLYVLVTLDKSHTLEVVPSISINQTVLGRVNSFGNISGKLPLALIRLEQDGTNDLSSYKNITKSMIEVYKGYGNFTLKGESGLTGPQGDTGEIGLDGLRGFSGPTGFSGLEGYPGATGPEGLKGDAGTTGLQGVTIPWIFVDRTVEPIAAFSGTPVSGSNPLTVQFTNLSEGEWNSIHWDFGDGVSSSSENPIHIYTSKGTYTVILYLQGTDWEDREIKYDYITVTS